MPVNVLVECPELIASVKVGVLNSLAPFEKLGICNIRFKKTTLIRADDIRWCDILVTVRGCEYVTLRIVRAAKKYKRLIVYYLDDDLLNVPIGEACSKIYYDQVIKKNMLNVIECADILWGVNEKIKDKYLPFCKGARWIFNRVPMNIGVNYELSFLADKIHILYAGSSGHSDMIQNILIEPIRQIAIEYEDKVDFTFIGVNPGIEDKKNIYYHPVFSKYSEYRNFVESGNFSIGLAAIYTDEFFQSKYYNKFLEYTSIGCVGIYTNVKPYTYVVENKINGILCDNDFEGWYNAIKLVIDDQLLRNSCIQNAQEYVKKYHDIEYVSQHFNIQFNELSSYKAPTIPWTKHVVFSPIILFVQSRIYDIFEENGVLGGCIVFIAKSIKYICRQLFKKI